MSCKNLLWVTLSHFVIRFYGYFTVTKIRIFWIWAANTLNNNCDHNK